LDRINAILNGLSVGQEVKVHINLGGREWVNPAGETKYFNSVRGWRIEKLSNANEIEVNSPKIVEPDNDLPF